ncbi:HNH endonuclease signature motif containing protein [Lacticaseibacillus salsurivasis]|uniref:HNH endonuclease signature motif containing protein n=1 Tax=Lacticaseibacillus salsurivasis TaxID=3081441 RepID=UPI0030C6D045
MGKAKYEYWRTDEGHTLMGGWSRQGLSDEQIAHNMGISRKTLAVWKNKYGDIGDTLKKGKAVADFEVENALFMRATGFNVVEQTEELIEDTGQNKRHKEVQALTEDDWAFAKAYFGDTCAYCGRVVDLTKDHLDPLKNGGKLDRYNVVPACQRCNSSKNDRQWLAWFGKQKFYDKQRAAKISDYIDLMLRLPKKSPQPKLTVTKKVTKFVPPDTAAMIYWLKVRDPEHWTEHLTAAQAAKASAEAKVAQAKADVLSDVIAKDGTVIVDDIPND